MPPAPPPPTRMMITDLDGTLLRSDHTVAAADLQTLAALPRQGVLRVLATGRSLFSLRRIAQPLPLDYAICSTGAGIYDCRCETLLRQTCLTQRQAAAAAGCLEALGLDYCVHDPLPENHRFGFRRGTRFARNPDFDARIALYRHVCGPLASKPETPASQLLIVIPADHGPALMARIRRHLPELSVVRTTSPLDHRSWWVEIFPPNVSKGGAAAWLSDRLGIPRRAVMFVGNDYNDADLLEWAAHAYVVANAPADLRTRFMQVASNDTGGVSQAVRHWLAGQSGSDRR